MKYFAIWSFVTIAMTLSWAHSPKAIAQQNSGAITVVSNAAADFHIHAGASLMWQLDAIHVYPSEAFDQSALRDLFMHEVEAVLTAKGYAMTTELTEADFDLGLLVALSSELNEAAILHRVGATPGLGESSRPERYGKGTVVLVLMDPNSQSIQWKVLLQGFADFEAQPAQREKRIRAIVLGMLSFLPTTSP